MRFRRRTTGRKDSGTRKGTPDSYYRPRWNEDGIPTKECLDELGLGYVSEEFLKRGILTDGAGASF
jgi:hypothetical protein